jgi:ABC-type antimicrobial peptide transport system permease subunit
MLLPWEYGVRNLGRRPLRTGLTLLALATVVLLVFVIVGFIRGLERSLAISGDPDVVLVYSVNSEQNLENSAIAAQIPSLLTASLSGTVDRFGISHDSPELFLGTRVSTDNHTGLGLVRGVTRTAPLVRRGVRLIEGTWPESGEVIVGRLAATKLGADAESLAIGRTLEIEGQPWRVAGRFVADGGAYESEIWCDLSALQTATKRQDISLVAMLLEPNASAGEVDLFCKQRTDLELRASRETDYYATLQQHYRPVRILAWMVVILISLAGVFSGLNMMYGAVAGRIRELATLQAIGYRRIAIVISLVQEGVILSAAASLISGTMALFFLNGLAVRFTMGAFALHVDSTAILIGCGVGLFIGVLGALPPALKALYQSVAISLKSV